MEDTSLRRRRTMDPRVLQSIIASLVAVLFLCPALGLFNAQAADPVCSSNDASDCLTCHRDSRGAILETPHAQTADKRTPFAAHACEGCHGPGADHVKGICLDQTLPPVVFGAGSVTPIEEQNEVCLRCHEGSHLINWTGSQHETADISCASCHVSHAVKDQVLERKSQAKTCYGCHTEQRADAHRRSRHPVTEGKVTCSDCHNSHGAFGPGLLREASVNDTCYTCHAEKRGPFLWEHAPVSDDCSNCHTPHGSNLSSLLTARTPWLCQECHQENYHPSSLYSGTGLPSISAEASMLGKDCMNCHPKIHGSNHPSGPRFTR